mmetsp:Transcript_34702/g.86061  ORF Transcript_34702/g.86061 Transcript_34702/m.86061 type:complete len:146 (+) Transcript_34702:194-631(+)
MKTHHLRRRSRHYHQQQCNLPSTHPRKHPRAAAVKSSSSNNSIRTRQQNQGQLLLPSHRSEVGKATYGFLSDAVRLGNIHLATSKMMSGTAADLSIDWPVCLLQDIRLHSHTPETDERPSERRHELPRYGSSRVVPEMLRGGRQV